jgi:hypothetical protein
LTNASNIQTGHNSLRLGCGLEDGSLI